MLNQNKVAGIIGISYNDIEEGVTQISRLLASTGISPKKSLASLRIIIPADASPCASY